MDDTTQANLDFYRKLWDDILNHGRFDLIGTHFSPDYSFKSPGASFTGVEAAKDHYGAYGAAFSDIEFVVHDAFGDGEKLAKHWPFRGTHTGELFGIPPTGKRVEMSGVTLARVADGKVMEEMDYAEDLSLMQQLGVIPEG